jgi:hypothetical protein
MNFIQGYLLFIGFNYAFVNKNNVELYDFIFLFFPRGPDPVSFVESRIYVH